MLMCIMVCFAMSLLPPIGFTVYTVKTTDNMPFSLCLPFVDPTNSLYTFKIITWLVSINQLLASVAIIIIYIVLIKELRQKRIKLKESRSKSTSNKQLILQLVIVSSSNILCWFLQVLFFFPPSLCPDIPLKYWFWTTVAVMPINSIVNPLVFCISTLKKKLNLFSNNGLI